MPNTYYISVADGADTNTGLSSTPGASGPFKTIAKINAITLAADDIVLFKKGESWSTETLNPGQSGSSGHPITFDAYSSGAIPIIKAVNIATGRTDLSFKNLSSVTAVNNANWFFAGSASRIVVDGCTVASAAYNFLSTAGAITGLTINNLTVTACASYIVRIDFTSGNSDIVITNVTSITHTSTTFLIHVLNCSNLTITNFTATGCAQPIYMKTVIGAINLSGITLTSPTGNGMVIESCTGLLTLSSFTSAGCGGAADLYFLNSTLTAGSTVSGVDINTFQSVGLRLDASSNIAFSNGSTSNGCLAVNAKAGVQTNTSGACTNISFTDWISSGNGNATGVGTGDGYWIDGTSSGFTFLRCAAQNNKGDGFGTHTSAATVTYTNCVASGNGTKTDSTASTGDGFTAHSSNTAIKCHYCLAYGNIQSGFAMIESSSGEIYNCVAYNNGGDWHAADGAATSSLRGGIYIGTSGGAGWIAKNNICSSNYPVEVKFTSGSIALVTFDYNQYYHPADGNFATLDNLATKISWATYHATPYEAHSAYGDPLFVSTVTPTFSLQSTSPAINAGVDVSLLADYIGTTVPNGIAPDIGAYESLPVVVPGQPGATIIARITVNTHPPGVGDNDSVFYLNLAGPVVLTTNLPVASEKMDARIIIEDGGAGDRNLVFYAGGQRFRVDGGSNV